MLARKENLDYAKLLDIAEARRKLEIELLWNRTLIFWGFTVVGFAAYAYCLDNLKSFDYSYGPALLVAIFGIITSLIWTMVNRGSKFWQEYWEDQIQRINGIKRGKAGKFKFFDDMENYKSKDVWRISIFDWNIDFDKQFFGWRAVRFSPSKLIIALSDFVVISWIVIAWMTNQVKTATATKIVTIDVIINSVWILIPFMVLVFIISQTHFNRKK